MKRLLLLLCLLASGAHANVPCTVPFNLQNGTTADANQVMANYNALITCLGQAAIAGQNNDITALLGLTTPLGPTFGGTNHFVGGISTGVNAVSVSVLPATFTTPQQGWQVSFTAGANSTSVVTLSINGGSALPVQRPTTVGSVPFAGSEFLTGNRIIVEFDGVVWQWMVPPIQVGRIIDSGGICPLGTLQANSQGVSRTGFAALFSVYGTTWGAGDGSTTFNLPDLRGRATYGLDVNQSGFANRITVGGGNIDGTILGNTGGLQNHTMTTTDLVPHSHTITDPGHTHTFPVNASAGANPGGTNSVLTSTGGTTNNSTTGIVINNTGTGAPFTILAPAAIVTKCVQP